MISKLIRLIFGALLVQLLTGCSTYTSVLSPNTGTDPEVGYVYGRYTLEKPDTAGPFFRLRAGLSVEEENGPNHYLIQFQPDGVPTVISVIPGTYVLKRMVFATKDYVTAGEKNFRDCLPAGEKKSI